MNISPSPNTRFQTGQSGNPEGRPKGSLSLVDIIRKKLEEASGNGDKTNAELLSENLVNMALKGNFSALRLIWSYVDGLPRQRIEMDANPPHPIPILGGLSVCRCKKDNKEEAVKSDVKS